MRTNSRLSSLVASIFVCCICSNGVDARDVRTYSGGRGYYYRSPNVESRITQWNHARLLSSIDRRRYAPLAAPFSFGDWDMKRRGADAPLTQREAIVLAQRSLRGLGYYRGADDGAMNRSFEQALRKFQADHGARNTGVVDAETIVALGL